MAVLIVGSWIVLLTPIPFYPNLGRLPQKPIPQVPVTVSVNNCETGSTCCRYLQCISISGVRTIFGYLFRFISCIVGMIVGIKSSLVQKDSVLVVYAPSV